MYLLALIAWLPAGILLYAFVCGNGSMFVRRSHPLECDAKLWKYRSPPYMARMRIRVFASLAMWCMNTKMGRGAVVC